MSVMINEIYKYKFIIIYPVNTVNISANSLQTSTFCLLLPVHNNLNNSPSLCEYNLFTTLSTIYSPTCPLSFVNKLSKELTINTLLLRQELMEEDNRYHEGDGTVVSNRQRPVH